MAAAGESGGGGWRQEAAARGAWSPAGRCYWSSAASCRRPAAAERFPRSATISLSESTGPAPSSLWSVPPRTLAAISPLPGTKVAAPIPLRRLSLLFCPRLFSPSPPKKEKCLCRCFPSATPRCPSQSCFCPAFVHSFTGAHCTGGPLTPSTWAGGRSTCSALFKSRRTTPPFPTLPPCGGSP